MHNTAMAALIAALAAAGSAQAQVTTLCQGRVFIDTVYQTSLGGNQFEYFIHVRNASRAPLTFDVTLTGFPGTVTLFSPSLPGIPVGANATISRMRIGRGTNAQIGVGTVARVYDVAPGSGPTVRLTNCRSS